MRVEGAGRERDQAPGSGACVNYVSAPAITNSPSFARRMTDDAGHLRAAPQPEETSRFYKRQQIPVDRFGAGREHAVRVARIQPAPADIGAAAHDTWPGWFDARVGLAATIIAKLTRRISIEDIVLAGDFAVAGKATNRS